MKSELENHSVRHDVISEIKSDDEAEIARFIKNNVDTSCYEKRLTQAEDVRQWIDDPTQISLIQPNLMEVASTLKFAKSPWSLIDIGCYAGYVYDYLSKKFTEKEFQYVGCDIRDCAINAARELHSGSTNSRFFTQDLFKLNEVVESRCYDFVFSARVLVHLPDFTRAVSNLVHCARKVTFLIMPVAEIGTTQYRHKVSLEDGSVMPYLYRLVSSKMLQRTAAEIGVPYRILSEGQTYKTILFESEKISVSFIEKFRRKIKKIKGNLAR